MFYSNPKAFHLKIINGNRQNCAFNKTTMINFLFLATGRSSFDLSASEATFFKTVNHILCRQTIFLYSFKILKVWEHRSERNEIAVLILIKFASICQLRRSDFVAFTSVFPYLLNLNALREISGLCGLSPIRQCDVAVFNIF